MGIFSRISDIVNSNLNALCDSAEDPEKMIRLIIQEMEDTLVEVRSASARVIAEQKTASRRRDRIAAEVAGWEDKAKLAVSKGRDDLAKAALQERRAVEETLRIVEDELTSSGEHIGQLNEEIGQLQQKLDDAKAKQKTILLRTIKKLFACILLCSYSYRNIISVGITKSSIIFIGISFIIIV